MSGPDDVPGRLAAAAGVGIALPGMLILGIAPRLLEEAPDDLPGRLNAVPTRSNSFPTVPRGWGLSVPVVSSSAERWGPRVRHFLRGETTLNSSEDVEDGDDISKVNKGLGTSVPCGLF